MGVSVGETVAVMDGETDAEASVEAVDDTDADAVDEELLVSDAVDD